MDLTEALFIADKVSNRELSWMQQPSTVNVVCAVEVLAAAFRDMERKREEWQARAENMRDTVESTSDEMDRLNEELDRTQGAWSDLMEFIRSALNLDARALDDASEARKILGRAFADARLWGRVKDMVGGKFVAGDVVTADAVNALSEAVKTSRATDVSPMGPAADDKRWKGFTTRILHNGMWMAPTGTDPADTDKWTWIGSGTPKLDILMGRDTAAVFSAPACQHFPAGAPEPDARVKRVRRVGSGTELVRAGRLSTGGSLWRRDGDDSGVLHLWSAVVKWSPVVEVPE